MVGKRHDMTEGDEILEPGEYGKHYLDGEWYCRAPQEKGFYAGMGRLSNHEVTEHEDGTITVFPSILIYGHHDRQWHGYLEHGVWREV
jgi:hypothetical protein